MNDTDDDDDDDENETKKKKTKQKKKRMMVSAVMLLLVHSAATLALANGISDDLEGFGHDTFVSRLDRGAAQRVLVLQRGQ